jgi:hypothetical protein
MLLYLSKRKFCGETRFFYICMIKYVHDLADYHKGEELILSCHCSSQTLSESSSHKEDIV